MLYNKFNVGDEVFITPKKTKAVIVGMEYDIDIQVFKKYLQINEDSNV